MASHSKAHRTHPCDGPIGQRVAVQIVAFLIRVIVAESHWREPSQREDEKTHKPDMRGNPSHECILPGSESLHCNTKAPAAKAPKDQSFSFWVCARILAITAGQYVGLGYFSFCG